MTGMYTQRELSKKSIKKIRHNIGLYEFILNELENTNTKYAEDNIYITDINKRLKFEKDILEVFLNSPDGRYLIYYKTEDDEVQKEYYINANSVEEALKVFCKENSWISYSDIIDCIEI